METTNGGENWNEVDVPISRVETYYIISTPKKLYFTAIDSVFNPVLVFLNKEHKTWHTRTLPQTDCSHMYFINDDIGFLTCNFFTTIFPDKVYKTEDGGQSWVKIDAPFYFKSRIYFSSLEEGFIINPIEELTGHFFQTVGFDVFQTDNGGLD